MKMFAGFSEEERRTIASFGISRTNAGSIYRNNRLIRWGEKLDIVSKDDYGFRGRIDITTEHDDLLHVDVSKQQLELSEQFKSQLKLLCRQPLAYAQQAFQECDKIAKVGPGVEGAEADASLGDMGFEDPELEPAALDVETIKLRRKTLEKRLSEAEGEPHAGEGAEAKPAPPVGVTTIPQEDPAGFQRIRYTEHLNSTDLCTLRRTRLTERTFESTRAISTAKWS